MVTFNHKFIDFKDLTDATNSNGVRHYETPSGKKYPSVTTVLGATSDKSALDEWRQRIGIEEATKITKQAAYRGSKMHKIFEDFLNNSLDNASYNPIQYTKFLECKPYFENCVGDIYGIEVALYSDKMKIAGRCDLIADWDSTLSIIDHKTSNRSKKEEWIEDYFIQKTLYSLMLYEMTGMMAKQIVTFITVDDETVPQIFKKKTIDYIAKAKERVRKYYEEQESN